MFCPIIDTQHPNQAPLVALEIGFVGLRRVSCYAVVVDRGAAYLSDNNAWVVQWLGGGCVLVRSWIYARVLETYCLFPPW